MGIHEKFFLIEDDPDDAIVASYELKKTGHELVGFARNFQGAIDIIPKLRETRATVVVLDGNLGFHQEDCRDGKVIAESIRKQVPDIIIVAHTASSEETANFGDIYVSKHAPSRMLTEAITAIPRN